MYASLGLAIAFSLTYGCLRWSDCRLGERYVYMRRKKKKTRTHIRSSHYGIYLMWILDFAHYDLFFHLIQIYVLDSKLSRGILGVIDLLLTSMRSVTAREDLVWGGLVFVHFFYNNVLLVFNEKLISLCNCYFIDPTQLLIPIVLPFTQIFTFSNG